MTKKKSSKKRDTKATQKNEKKSNEWLWLLLMIPMGIASFFLFRSLLNSEPAHEETPVATPMIQSKIDEPEVEPTEPAEVSQDPRILPQEISVDEAFAYWEDGVFFLDVRELHEWNAGHIPGATLVPLDFLALNSDVIPYLEPVIIVCRSGNRSAQARDLLMSQGFKFVTSMAVGMNDWIAAGYDIVIED